MWVRVVCGWFYSVGMSIKAGPLAAPPLTPHQASPEDSQVPSPLGCKYSSLLPSLSLLFTSLLSLSLSLSLLQELVKNFDESHMAYSIVEVILWLT